jgi:hypothetical protein
MKTKTKIRITLYVGLSLCFLLFKFGRSIWHPVYTKISGKTTTQEVYEKIGADITPKLKSNFTKANLPFPPNNLTIIALKKEQVLEIWSANDGKNTLIKSYAFTGYSGKLGPKLKSGDLQIPEGLYRIEYLNPNSSYHLSAKISYPNKFDREMGNQDNRSDLGGDIFIHGKSATIGCIPIGDTNIEELFTLIYLTGKSKVNVIISPNDLRLGKPAYSNPDIPWLPKKYVKIKNELSKFTRS